MKLQYTTMERMAGLFILAAFLLFLGSAITVGRWQNWFQKHNDYYAVYKEGYNLQPGAKVKLLRTDIGQVTSIELTDSNRVKVNMRILADFASRIKTDSKAAVESPTLIGSEFISIVLGDTPGATVIEPGGQIPAKEKKTLTDYIEELELEHKMLIAEEILENIADITERASNKNGPLFGTLANIRTITDQIAKGEGNIGKLIGDDELYVSILNEVKKLDEIISEVNNAVQSIGSVAVDAKKISNDLKKKTPDITSQVADVIERLEAITVKLEKAMKEAPEISQEARAGMRDVNQILYSVKKNFLIRGNLPPSPASESEGVQMRGD